jgi:hypothetical protein
MQLATLAGRGKYDMKYVGKLERVLFIKVILPPLEKYILFQLAKRRSIFSITPSQIDLALKGNPNGRPRYFKGKDTPHSKRLARPSTLLTLSTRTSSSLVTLIFKPKIAS